MNYLSRLSETERKVFGIHLLYSAIEGILSGLLLLNEFVYLKSMGGSSAQLAVLFQFSVIILLVSIFLNQLLQRIGTKKRLMTQVGVITRFPLLLFFFFPQTQEVTTPFYHTVFLGIFFVYYLANPVVFPIINQLLKSNYSHENFGKLYSYTGSLKKVLEIVITLIFGILLDYNSYAFVYVYPLMGLLGMVSIFLLTTIPYTPDQNSLAQISVQSVVIEPFVKMVKILKTNKPFFYYQLGFMFYGFAFMLTYAIIIVFLGNELNLSFSAMAFYKNYYNILAIVSLPFFGKVMGEIDPRKFGVFTFAMLMLHIVFVALTDLFPQQHELWGLRFYYMLFISYTFFGIFTATMALLWSIGSAYFCKPEEAGFYQSIHLTLTGFRGLFSPVVGVLFFGALGFQGVFWLGAFSILIGMLVLFWSYKKQDLQPTK